MNKRLDRLFLVLAIAAIVAQVAFVVSPNAPALLQPMALVIFALAGAYFFFLRPSPKQDDRSTGLIDTATSDAQRAYRYEAERTYRYSATRYGMGYGKLEVSCTILSDGSASIQRDVKIEAYSQLSKLETSLLIPEADRSGKDRKIDFNNVQSTEKEYTVAVSNVIPRERKQIAEITFAPQLQEGSIAGFKMTELLPSGLYGVCLSRKELEQRQVPYDYFGWNIDRPARHLSLRVYFPDGVLPVEYTRQVRYATPSFQDEGATKEKEHFEEMKRLSGPFLEGPEGGRYILRLDVEYPMLGLIYILGWKYATGSR